MSEKKTETGAKPAVTEKKDGLMEFTAPLLPGQERQDLVVGVNGKFIRIRRGETVRIRPEFVGAIRNAQRQQAEAYKAQRAQQ